MEAAAEIVESLLKLRAGEVITQTLAAFQGTQICIGELWNICAVHTYYGTIVRMQRSKAPIQDPNFKLH